MGSDAHARGGGETMVRDRRKGDYRGLQGRAIIGGDATTKRCISACRTHGIQDLAELGNNLETLTEKFAAASTVIAAAAGKM